jgi:glycosyltransferase involved in cell wall biosynthesis
MVSRMPERLVTVASYGADGSSARVRILDWLAHTGIAADIHQYTGAADNQPATLARSPFRTLSAEVEIRRLHRALSGRTLLLGRRATPFSAGTVESRLLSSAARGVYDVDDALYADTGGSALRRVWPAPRLWHRAVAAADVVIAGNEVLAERAARGGGEVVIIPSCVEPGQYRPKTDYERGDSPRAIWIGSPSTEHHLSLISGALSTLHRRHGMRLTVVSAGSASLGALDPMVDRVAWHPLTFSQALSDADVGIMPLQDTEFSRGKCGYKLLQYAAAALPVVGSPVGANAAVLAALGGEAPRDAEWVDALACIVEASASARMAMGGRARHAVEESFSFTAWADRWRDAVGV